MKTWFISHPSAGPQHTPTFFDALEIFGREHSNIELVMPHDAKEQIDLTRQDIEQADLVIAEISIASTGSGIELGWANAAGKKIIAFHQNVDEPSPSVQFVTQSIHPYITTEHIVAVLNTFV